LLDWLVNTQVEYELQRQQWSAIRKSYMNYRFYSNSITVPVTVMDF